MSFECALEIFRSIDSPSVFSGFSHTQPPTHTEIILFLCWRMNEIHLKFDYFDLYRRVHFSWNSPKRKSSTKTTAAVAINWVGQQIFNTTFFLVFSSTTPDPGKPDRIIKEVKEEEEDWLIPKCDPNVFFTFLGFSSFILLIASSLLSADWRLQLNTQHNKTRAPPIWRALTAVIILWLRSSISTTTVYLRRLHHHLFSPLWSLLRI